MALRPFAVSVVLAAALVGMNVLHDGGEAVIPVGPGQDPGAAGVVVPTPGASPTPANGAPAGSPAPSSPGPGTTGGSAPSPSPRAPLVVPDGPRSAADRFRVWDNGPRATKLVALTFDDGWSGPDLRRIVAILTAKQAPATFFPVARAVQRNPNTWRAIAAAGFPIGNHSWNHDDLSKGKASAAQADIEKATRVIERVSGAPLFPAIRPPFGATDASFLKAAEAAGMRAVVLWDVDTRDWTGIRAGKVLKAALTARSGSIVVMHTDKANTVKALPKIIDRLRARGYTLVTVGQLLGLPGPVPTFMDRAQREDQRGR